MQAIKAKRRYYDSPREREREREHGPQGVWRWETKRSLSPKRIFDAQSLALEFHRSSFVIPLIYHAFQYRTQGHAMSEFSTAVALNPLPGVVGAIEK